MFEQKLDGFRALAIVEAGDVRLLSRNGRSLAEQFPEVKRALQPIASDVVLDCELVVPDERGHPDFEEVRRRSLIQRRALIDSAAAETPATLCPFDLLARDDEDLRSLPLVERKRRLFDAVRDAPNVRAVRYLEAQGHALFKQAVALDLEGIVAKRADAPYQAGRQSAWLKVKHKGYWRQEAVSFGR